ncbi:MAG: hypothetical protein RIM72_14655 [Alphaproteobacteria bacterium]
MSTLWIWGDKAFTSETSLARIGRLFSAARAETVETLDLFPKLVYRVVLKNGTRLVTDPVEVRHLVRGDDKAKVSIIPVVA